MGLGAEISAYRFLCFKQTPPNGAFALSADRSERMK